MLALTIASDFVYSSEVVDEYLLAMASLYLKRAGLNSMGYAKDRYFFYALYLAIGTASPPLQRYSVVLTWYRTETEEDLPRGAEEIILYLIGPAPEPENDCFVLAPTEQQREWSRRLSRFLAGKDKVGRCWVYLCGLEATR
jgi:hypothetical protein